MSLFKAKINDNASERVELYGVEVKRGREGVLFSEAALRERGLGDIKILRIVTDRRLFVQELDENGTPIPTSEKWRLKLRPTRPEYRGDSAWLGSVPELAEIRLPDGSWMNYGSFLKGE